jgi:endoglucanase
LQQRQRVEVRAVDKVADAYYEAVLSLFGRGWDEGWFRFGADGRLQTRWEQGACSVLR